MKKISMLLAVSVAFIFNSTAQNLDGYKYVIVPNQYGFLKGTDKYKLNSLTKFLFEKENFSVIYGDQKYPSDLANNPCLGLKTNVTDNSNMLVTRLTIKLLDCNNEIIFSSQEGKSKIKDFERGHHDALRKAFESVKEENYSFNRDKAAVIKKVEKEEVDEEAIDVENNTAIEVEEEAIANNSEVKEVEMPLPTAKEQKIEVKNANGEDVKFTLANDGTKSVLYAQSIPNGIQLVDSTPKIVFKALKSSNKENLYYLESKAGILYKKDEIWYAEYYKGDELVVEKLTIKF